MLHKLFDKLNLPRKSATGQVLGIGGRLTFGWLWTDDPKYGELDEELDQAQRNKVKMPISEEEKAFRKTCGTESFFC